MKNVNAIFLVPFRPDRQIRQGIKAIEAEETDSDDDIETNDDVDGLVFELAATCELKKRETFECNIFIKCQHDYKARMVRNDCKQSEEAHQNCYWK